MTIPGPFLSDSSASRFLEMLVDMVGGGPKSPLVRALKNCLASDARA